MLPADRYRILRKRRSYRYQLAKITDPESVRRFEDRANAQRSS